MLKVDRLENGSSFYADWELLSESVRSFILPRILRRVKRKLTLADKCNSAGNR
jgi:hypothetical protein